jgi:hypothetical protein
MNTYTFEILTHDCVPATMSIDAESRSVAQRYVLQHYLGLGHFVKKIKLLVQEDTIKVKLEQEVSLKSNFDEVNFLNFNGNDGERESDDPDY